MIKLLTVFCATVVAFGVSHAQTISVNPSNDANYLANLIVGSGVTYSNASTLGNGTSMGAFTGGNNVGGGFIKSGILLTSGNATGAPGPNSSDSFTGNTGSSVGAGTEGSKLSFDFTVDTDGDIYFNYIFASEEENEYADSSYNDGFKLFLSGGGYSNQNLAIIPGSGQEVTINNLNGSVDDNPHLFNNNDPSDFSINNTPYNIQYDGFTDILTATATVQAGVTYTMEFLVYDVGDSSYDSAVFIQGASFSTDLAPVPEPGLIGLVACLGLGMVIFYRRRK